MLCDAHGFIARLVYNRLQELDTEISRLKLEKSVLETDPHLEASKKEVIRKEQTLYEAIHESW